MDHNDVRKGAVQAKNDRAMFQVVLVEIAMAALIVGVAARSVTAAAAVAVAATVMLVIPVLSELLIFGIALGWGAVAYQLAVKSEGAGGAAFFAAVAFVAALVVHYSARRFLSDS